MSEQLRYKKVNPAAVEPAYAHDGDSGFDLYATEDVIIAPGSTEKVPTGLAFEIPEGYELQVRPKSGISTRTKLRVTLGTVDSNYRGEVSVMVDNIFTVTQRYNTDEYGITEYYPIPGETFDVKNEAATDVPYGNHSHGTYIIRKGEKIAQAVLAPVSQAEFLAVGDDEELGETSRGNGGFGSTGLRENNPKTDSEKVSEYRTDTTVYFEEGE